MANMCINTQARLGGDTIASSELNNEPLVMVLTDLAALCKKLTQHPVVPEDLRATARNFVAEFHSSFQFRATVALMSMAKASIC